MKSPLITMSAVTGKPSRKEIFDYLKGLKDCGIDQAMIYPRSGCELDYLEDEWFEVVGFFIDGAKELDMLLWIYDDFNWPSGDAHGRVSKIPEYRLRAICTKGEKCGEINCYSKNKGSLFGEVYFPNLLDDKAMDYFIECTHEQYYKRFGQYFGTIIKGFYTDEPGVGYCCTDESMPYYEGMAEDYKAACGRDFVEDMKANHEDFYKISLNLVGRQYRKTFASKLAKWCEEHNVALTGHLMEDTTPHGATKQCGDALKALSAFTVPGIDELRTRFKDTCIYNLLGTVQYAHGKNGAMAELFALGPCDLSFANKRSIIFLCACFGINNYFLATSPIDMRGNMHITDYFNLFTPDSPDFPGTRLLSEQAKIAAFIAEKDFIPKVYIRYPTEICAKHLHGNLNLMRFFKLVNYLTYNQIQWKYADNIDVISDVPVIEFTEELEYLVEGKKVTLEQVLERFSVTPAVTKLDGSIDEGIFVREFSDGTMVVLNLFAEEGMYLVDGKRVYLEENAVRVYNGNVEEYMPLETSEASIEFEVKYHNDNMIRTMYVNDADTATVMCDDDTEVVFAVRNDVNAAVNGIEVDTTEKEWDGLTFGFRKLYSVSEKITLAKGENSVTSSKDKKYLPSVFLIGNFSCSSNGDKVSCVSLGKRAKIYRSGDILNDFGTVEFISEIKVPYKAKAVVLEGVSLCTEVYIDDKYCGMNIFRPYRFELPENSIGKTVQIRIVQKSSLGPVFGDVEYYTQNSSDTNWITPGPVPACYGMKQIKFEML